MNDLIPQHQQEIYQGLQELMQQIKSAKAQEKNDKEKALENRLNALIFNFSSPPDPYFDMEKPQDADIRRIMQMLNVYEDMKTLKDQEEIIFPIDLRYCKLPKNFSQIEIPLDAQFKLTPEQILRIYQKNKDNNVPNLF